MLSEENHSDVAGSLLDDIGYTEMLQNEKTPADFEPDNTFNDFLI